MDIILIYIIGDKFNIIAKRNLIKNININKSKYELVEYDDKIGKYTLEKIYKEISTIYFSNVSNIKNNLFSSSNEKKNYYNISFMSDLKTNFIDKTILMNRYTINEHYVDNRFFKSDYEIIQNYRIEKNLKYIFKDNIFNIQKILMIPKAYLNQSIFFENPLNKLRIYNTNKLENNSKISNCERKIYNLLEKEFKKMIEEKSDKKEIAKNIMYLIIIDKYFDELYGKLNNSSFIKYVNKKFDEYIMSTFKKYNTGFKKIQECLKMLKDDELKKIYSIEEKDESVINFATMQYKNFIKKYNEKYDNLLKIIGILLNSDNVEIDIEKTGYSTGSIKHLEYILGINIKKDKFDFLNSLISESKELLEIFSFKYNGISSGEQALLDIYAEFYNISEDIKTDSIVIFMDEPELYFHPEWQRELIYRFIEFFNRDFPDKKIQIIFSSNSPYVLSDLPPDNVVMLGENMLNSSTFANNIHTILKENYFLNSTIGKFANSKIEKILKNINSQNTENKKICSKNNYKEDKMIIDIIGEPLLRNKLYEMLREYYDKNT
jgi:hypothetical protein